MNETLIDSSPGVTLNKGAFDEALTQYRSAFDNCHDHVKALRHSILWYTRKAQTSEVSYSEACCRGVMMATGCTCKTQTCEISVNPPPTDYAGLQPPASVCAHHIPICHVCWSSQPKPVATGEILDNEIEVLAVSRIATWLLQKYDSEYDASQVPLDVWQSQAKEIWDLVRHYPKQVPEGEFIQVVGHFSNVPLARKAMGIDWLGQNELREAIPPAYSKYIAEAWINQIEGEK